MLDRAAKDATKGALTKLSLCGVSYYAIYICFLLFAYLAAVLAWIFANGSIYALVWDGVYSFLLLLATLGLALKNGYLMLSLGVALIGDSIIAAVVAVLLAVTSDTQSIGLFDGLDAQTGSIIFGAFAAVQLVMFVIILFIAYEVNRAIIPYRRSSSVSSGTDPEPVIHRV